MTEAFGSSEFRTSNRKRLLRGIFYETTTSDKSTVLYTLKDEDHLGFPSLSRLYLETEDPTEYEFARLYLESWDHWQELCECSWFKDYVSRWRKELEVKIRSKALRAIKSEATNNGKNSFAANKLLLEGGWLPKDTPKRGRPTKDEIQKAANDEVDFLKRISDDFTRLDIN